MIKWEELDELSFDGQLSGHQEKVTRVRGFGLRDLGM